MITWLWDFSGGENRKARQSRIADNESPRLRNARWTLQGALTKRDGVGRTVVTDASSRIVSLFSYQLSTMADDQLLMADDNGTNVRIFRTTDLSTFTQLTLATALGRNYQPEFAILNDLVVFCNGQNATQTINASNTVSNLTDAPASRFVTVHKNRLFFFNDSSTPNYSRLQWSDANATAFTAANFETIDLSSGTVGIGMFSFGEELVLFKGPRISGQPFSQSSMYALLGSDFDATNPTYSIERIPLPPGIGLLGHRTIRPYKGALLFATNQGVYAYHGGGRMPENISDSIRDEYFLTASAGWAQSPGTGTQGKPCATVWNDRYILCVDNQDETSASNNRIYVLDGGKWWVDTIGGTADSYATSGGFSDFATFAGANEIYGSSDSQPVIRLLDAGSFNEVADDNTAAPVNFSYLTKEYDLESEHDFKVCYVHLRRQTGTLTFEFNVDQRGAVSSSLDMSAVDTGDVANTSSNILRKQVLIGRHGRTIQFRFFNRGAADVEIYGIELYHQILQSTQLI